MRKNFVILLTVLLIITLSGNIFAKRLVLIDPGHGGSDTGFDLFDGLEKELNLDLALKLGEYIEKVAYTRTTDVNNPDNQNKVEQAIAINPDFIVSIHHHGKQSVFIEYNRAARATAFQIAAYYAANNVHYRLVPLSGVWLYDLPKPAVTLIVTKDIVNQTDLVFLANLLEGLD